VSHSGESKQPPYETLVAFCCAQDGAPALVLRRRAFLAFYDSTQVNEAIQSLQNGDGSGALYQLEEVFQQCGWLEATPHYLIYEAALQVLEAECPSPEYRPNVVLEIHDRTVPSLIVLARQYCYERTSRALHHLSSPSDLQYEAVPYAITARDWRALADASSVCSSGKSRANIGEW
jgi:hypothetical protein